jgi:Domain of unknown function (DUF4252)
MRESQQLTIFLREDKMKNLLKLLPVLILFFSISLCAQEKYDYSNDPGYVDFGDLSKFQNDSDVTEVLVERNLLKMVANATRNSDTALYDLLNGLKLVKVNSFRSSEKDKTSLTQKMESINKNLISKDWDRIVHVKSGDEYTNVFIKSSSSDDNIYGLVVTSYQKDGEASFVNIVGKINLESIGRLGAKFDIPSLDHITKKKGK